MKRETQEQIFLFVYFTSLMIIISLQEGWF